MVSQYMMHFFMDYHDFWFMSCWQVREEEDETFFFQIRIFRVKNDKTSNRNCVFSKISAFAVQGAFLHGSSQFWVCELLVGGR